MERRLFTQGSCSVQLGELLVLLICRSSPSSFEISSPSMAFTSLIRRRPRFFFAPTKPPPPVAIAASRHISSTAAATTPPMSADPEPKLSLSARLSFVFDQIDALERQRDTSARDEALQRIRSWRLSKHPPPSPPSSTSTSDITNGESKTGDTDVTEDAKRAEIGMAEFFQREVEVVHPWPEWIELMERLASQNYFDYRRVEEDRVAADAGIDLSGVKETGLDLTRDWMAVKTACMNFGRDRFDILKSLSRKDIQTLVGHGCPSMDAKAVLSAKLLRKYVHLDEGDVCSSCFLRNTCSRGYILVPKEDEARTIDVMHILLRYGFDFVKKTVDNDNLRKMKSVKAVVRKLLHEVVKLSAVPRDPNLLPPVIKKLPPKVKQPPPQPKRRVGRDDVEMKKGDWLCPKCDFMNFAKNLVCLQCDAKRPKRQLLPGEWECPKCNFLNYRRNTSCFQCEHTRPPDEFTENQMQEKRMSPNTRVQRTPRMSDVSKAWNFDFDDDESDGADVAAFEFADSSKGQNNSFDEPRIGNFRQFEDDTVQRKDRGRYSINSGKVNHSSKSEATGFDDFDDEEDDTVDSYILDVENGKEKSQILRKSLSDFENGSESEDFDDHDDYSKPSQHRKDSLSDFENDETVISARKTSHYSRTFDSSDDMEHMKDSEQDLCARHDLKRRKNGQKGFSKEGDSDFDDDIVSDFDDEDGDDLYSYRRKKKATKDAPEKIERAFRGSYTDGSKNSRKKSFDNDDNLYSRGSRGERIDGRSERSGRRFQDSSRFGSKNNGRNSFDRRDVDNFDQAGRSLDRRRTMNRSSDGAKGFQKSRMKGNAYDRHHDRNGHNHGRSSGFNDDYGFDDNNRRRRVIER